MRFLVCSDKKYYPVKLPGFAHNRKDIPLSAVTM
jgi:hypothetical protein